MNEISPQIINKIAELAKLSFTDNEKIKIKKQLTEMVSYFEKLDELDTTGIVPMTHPFNVDRPLREDLPGTSLSTDEILGNAPELKMNYFVVPKMI